MSIHLTLSNGNGFRHMQIQSEEAVHLWLIWLKATQTIAKYAIEGIRDSGLGDSDFRVLEVLLHKGPLPVNTIGPTVNLTPGSISVAVDRLRRKGLVSRIESVDDRRVRIVELTKKGRDLIVPVFQKHSATMKMVFSRLTPQELRELEATLKRVGKHAATLGGVVSSVGGSKDSRKGRPPSPAF
jgi:MarR family 2-MHQ and catechol resistance regulon transcriptional repressor